MSKKYYFLCNHWTEAGIGYAFPKGFYNDTFYNEGFSTVYTVEKMLDGADEFGIVTSMELDSYSYEMLDKVAKNTLDRLKQYIKENKVSVSGGTYGQPLGQDYGWESNIRQLTYGKNVIKNLLDYDVLTFLVEEQWFFPQLPQLLKKSGFKYASLQCQNSGQVLPINKSMVNWVGLDGTSIPTIPANDIMVSCVRQYGNYDMYDEIIEKYDTPLLFQWVEVWVPGMDWGASITPFEKAINDAKEKGYISVSIDDYFEKEVTNIEKEDVFIKYDDSNYGNDWYQGGGWGFEGDKVIYLNNICEEKMSALESYLFTKKITEKINVEQSDIDYLWKKILLLQNHDVSAARSYRAYTKDGICTTANDLVLNEYKDVINKIDNITDGSLLEIGINKRSFYIYNEGYVTQKFKVKSSKYLGVRVNGKHIESSQYKDSEYTYITATLFVEPFATYDIEVYEDVCNVDSINNCTEYNYFENDDFIVSHEKGWEVKIKHKESNSTVVYEAFSGSISKANEHGGNFYALSPAHLQFTFHFDGSKHCPDQTSSMHVKCVGIVEDELFISLKLRCDLLTLHTTDTPVAFATAEVKINKLSKIVDVNSFIYSGVYLNVDAYSKFTFDNDNLSVYRDYPFYEEKANIENLYALSYMRVEDEKTGVTIKNYGSQRVIKNKNTFKYKICKGNILNEYEFKFSIKFGTTSPIDSLNFVNQQRCIPVVANETIKIQKSNETTVISQFFVENNNPFIRIVNYSENEVVEKISIETEFNNIIKAEECNMLGEFVADIDINNMMLSPFEIKTIRLHI